jgi:hypothetical protein
MIKLLSMSFLLTLFLSESVPAQNPIRSNCEEHSASLDFVRQEALSDVGKDGVIIAIARLGTGESSRALNRRRLSNVSVNLRDHGFSVKRLIVAQGERVSGYGRVELYVAGNLSQTLYAVRHKDLCVDCCDIDERYYPYRKDRRRRRE